ncbi:hypothetical protein FOA52_006634 [Chlamydomonas sp. UWO 241]|nr:hypothetical protein FOA52_006634 [Chlamydomonas sp. UWO 241]
MIRAFDSRAKGGLDLDEFSRLHQFLGAANASFYAHDADRSGQLSVDEVQKALAQAGFNIDAPVVKAAIVRHNTSKTDALQLTEFIQLCLMLQNCHRAFRAFDAQGQGRVTLSLNQFVYAFSSV